ncbi:large subunit ribosomal protein L14e [Nematocida sp. AWRm77]|nr:large subunit ribosomal protein L14e [Nematocida sp. AWRm77]
MRDLIEKGRVVEFKCTTMATKIGVIVDFVTQSSFVIQIVCAKTGKAVERSVISQKHITLTKSVISVEDTDSERGEAFEAAVEEAIKDAVSEKQNTEAYKKAIYLEKHRELNDFERFLEEQKTLAQEKVLRSKGF